MATRLNSNDTSTAMAWEQVVGVAPTTGDYRALDLNSYSDAGASYENTARSVMDGDRQLLKGAQTSKTAAFGYNIDNTILNTAPQVAAFMWKAPREQANTRSIVALSPFSAVVPATVTAWSGAAFTVSGSGTNFSAGDIIVCEDMVNNRFPLVVSAATATTVTAAPVTGGTAPVALGTRPDARLVKVGKVCPVAVTLAATAANATLTLASGTWAALGLFGVGDWIFVGGDDAANRFTATDPFYARVSAINGLILTLDTTTRAIVGDTCSALHVYLATQCTNGKTLASMTHNRYLGLDPDNKHMREVITGCMANEMSINSTEKALVTQDFSFIAMDAEYPLLDDVENTALQARIIPPPTTDAINTSTDVVRQRMSVLKIAQMNTAEIHSFVQELNVSVTNNLSEDTAMGHVGNVGATAGDFGVTGNATLYFNSTAALNAIKCNCTVGLDMIYARKNAGIIVDIPELTLSGDGIQVEKGASIKLALDQNAFKSRFGYTMNYVIFHYLPNAAMPAQTACNC